jgi:hypothetical protein
MKILSMRVKASPASTPTIGQAKISGDAVTVGLITDRKP